MGGANNTQLISNIEWFIKTYNIPNGSTQGQTAPKQTQNKSSPYKLYKDEVQPFFFSNENWEKIIPKISAYFQSKGLLSKSDFRDVQISLKNVQGFGKTSADNKMIVTTKVIENAPLDDPQNLVPFLDFLRLACLEQEVGDYIAESVYDILTQILRDYFLENNFKPDQNPKAVRIVTWRLITNLTKFENGTDLLFSEYDTVLLSAQTGLTKYGENNGMVKALTMALNNLLFAEYGLECDDQIKFELVGALVNNLSGKDENTTIASLNTICRLVKDDKELIARVKAEQVVLTAKIDALKYNGKGNAKIFAEDLDLMLGR